jgi:hypothetical protein
MAVFDFIKPLIIKAPEVTYFNHLLGEFESFEAAFARDIVSTADKPAAQITQTAGEPAPASDQDGEDAQQSEEAGEPNGGQVEDAAQPQSTAADADARAASETAVATRRSDEVARRVIAGAKSKIRELTQKRDDETLDWNDLYLFEMLLAEVRPAGTLRSKVLSLRRDYRSIAGQIEYDEYLASKPKNLLDPPDPRDPPDADANYESLLRDDLKDLLGRLFKRYAILPIREARLKRLTIWAALFCGLFLLILMIFILRMDKPGSESAEGNANTARGNSNTAQGVAPPGAAGLNVTLNERLSVPSIALFVVLVSGAMGGFVSALQRIQSSPTEGDSLYNLAMLYHGSYAVFVAPLTGAIFGILLYLMFTGKILEGRFFPDIYTPAATTITATPTPTPARPAQPAAAPVTNTNTTTPPTNANRRPAPTPTPATTPPTGTNTNASVVADTNTNTNTAGATNTNENTANVNTSGTSTAAPIPRAVATPTPPQVPTASLAVRDFLYESGPAGGQDYALLIIWSFIAGFAERFVPDSLNRLVAGRQSGNPPGA